MEDWNSMEYATRENYKHVIFSEALHVFCGAKMPVVNGVAIRPLWFLNREIRVFWEPSVPSSTALLICRAIERRIEECGTFSEPFEIKMYGSDESAMSQLNSATVNGQVDHMRLFGTCLTEVHRDENRGGRQHADVFITTRSLLGDHVSWGVSQFAYGTMVFALHGNRCNHEQALFNLAMHETTHLLGMGTHCDLFQNVEGYEYSSQCNMHYDCLNKPLLCSKCRDFVDLWWSQIAYMINNKM
jgi:hypothetical protein